MITDPYFYLLAIPSVTFLGLSKGGFAGVGMVSTPLLALYLPPLQAAAILLPILLVQDAISIWTYRLTWDPWNVKVLTAGSIFGIVIAGVFAAYVSDDAVRLIVGVIGVVFSLNAWFGRQPAQGTKPSVASGLFWGAAAGFTSTMSQVGAPPFQVFILPQRLEKMVLVGTTTMFFAAVNLFKVAPYLALGQFSTAGLATSVVLLPIAVATNFVGIWLVRITPTAVFYRVAYVVVFVISLALLWQGCMHVLGR